MLNWLKLRLRALFRRATMEEELDEELSYHLERDIQRHIARGMSPDEARSAVRRGFGNVEALKEESRDARGIRLVEDLLADLRYALRVLHRSPGFAAVAVLTIALGMGANTAIFTIVDAILLKTIPVHEPGQLFFLDVVGSDGNQGAPPYPAFERLRDHSQSFSGMAAFASRELALTIDGRAERASGQVASASYFDVLGVEAVLGRTFEPSDERLDPPVAVLSYHYWQRRFGGDPNIVGKTVGYTGERSTSEGQERTEDRALTIVGVTPPEFFGLSLGHRVDVTIPITVVSAEQRRDSHYWWLGAVARLEPGLSPERAHAEIDPIWEGFIRDAGFSAEERDFDGIELTPASRGDSFLRNQFSKPLLLLTGIVGLVLLIACTNIANLLLARATARRREFAVRMAIGASRFRLVRQLLAESLLLFATGSAVGLLFAGWGVRALARFFAVGRSPILLDLQLDLRVLFFTAALCLITGILFGLVPALRAARVEPYADIKDGVGRAASARLRLPVGRVLVVCQVTLSLVLLVGAGLFAHTLSNLKALDLGFRPANVLTLDIEPLESRYPHQSLPTLWTSILDRVRTLPGVRSASLSRHTPLSGTSYGTGVNLLGVEHDQHMFYNEVSPEYFETMGIPLRLGRTFTSRDGPTTPRVAILNETAARSYFGDRNPLGARVETSRFESSGEVYGGVYSVIGTVGDSKHLRARDEAPPLLYVPVLQSVQPLGFPTLAVRATADAASLIDAVRRQIREIGPAIFVTNIAMMEEQVDHVFVRERLVAMLSGGFGILGLLLAAIGLHGVMAYTVVRRTSEIGIRMALGASATAVSWQVVREALIMASIGVAIGLPLSLLAARAAASLLFGVQPTDAATLSVSASVLLVVATIAAYLPARRAARIDPMVALRHE
ncbi:MAG: FtsX-like permease family protein [Luteitalea sp.]|nr:FtsX-like permease family protein [Luteitalea sp.]